MIGWVLGFGAVVGGAMLLRKYLYSKPIEFSFEGQDYVRHPDGRFTSAAGAPVIDPELERVKAHWDRMNEVEA